MKYFSSIYYPGQIFIDYSEKLYDFEIMLDFAREDKICINNDFFKDELIFNFDFSGSDGLYSMAQMFRAIYPNYYNLIRANNKSLCKNNLISFEYWLKHNSNLTLSCTQCIS